MGTVARMIAAGSLACAAWLGGCSGASSSAQGRAEEDGGRDTPQGAALPAEAPGGEMIMGLSVPGIAGAETPPAGEGKEPSEMDRNDVVKAANAALEGGRIDEAVSFGDVLLIMFPSDPEGLEIRGRALVRQGDAEGGAADLQRCCELGRTSCCE